MATKKATLKKTARAEKRTEAPAPQSTQKAAAAVPEKVESAAAQSAIRETGGIRLREAAAADPGKPKPRRIGFNLTDEGKIDWDGMKGGNRAEVKEVLMADPELRSALLGGDEEELTFDKGDVKDALEMLNEVNKGTTGFVFGRLRKWPIDPRVLDRAFECPPRQPELAAKFDGVCERGAAVANRHLPAFLKKWMNEILFVTGYLAIVKTQVQAAVKMQNQINAAAAARAEQQPEGGKPAEQTQQPN